MSTAISTVDRTASLGASVAERPARAEVFERLRLEYCCGGRQTLREACAGRGLEVEAARAALEALETVSVMPRGLHDPDWRQARVVELCAHIVAVHHEGLREGCSRIEALLRTVVSVHGAGRPELRDLQQALAELRAEFEPHLTSEAELLFPACVELERQGVPIAENLIEEHEHEHARFGDALHALRALGGDYDPGPALCATHRSLLDALAAFERKMHQHVHLENSVPIPRVRTVRLRGGTDRQHCGRTRPGTTSPVATRPIFPAAVGPGSSSRPAPGLLAATEPWPWLRRGVATDEPRSPRAAAPCPTQGLWRTGRSEGSGTARPSSASSTASTTRVVVPTCTTRGVLFGRGFYTLPLEKAVTYVIVFFPRANVKNRRLP